MNNTISQYLRIFVFVIILFLFIAIAWFHFFDLSLYAFQGGKRNLVLILELFLIPIFTIIGLIHLSINIYKDRKMSISSVYLALKYLGLLVFMILVLFILSILVRMS